LLSPGVVLKFNLLVCPPPLTRRPAMGMELGLSCRDGKELLVFGPPPPMPYPLVV